MEVMLRAHLFTLSFIKLVPCIDHSSCSTAKSHTFPYFQHLLLICLEVQQLSDFFFFFFVLSIPQP